MEAGELPADRGRRALKLDLYKQFKKEYVAPRTPALVMVGPARYLTITGRGGPTEAAFTTAISALYGVAFTIKMARKFAGRDYAVPKLEGRWWGGERGKLLIDSLPATWRWQLLLRVPSFVSAAHRAAALTVLARRGKSPLTRRVKLETIREGRSVQLLHVGAYDAEHDTIRRMEEFARAAGWRFAGRHHEIYLSDPRRVPPARLRTILRYPVKSVAGSHR